MSAVRRSAGSIPLATPLFAALLSAMLVVGTLFGGGAIVSPAGAQGLADDGNASWRLEQPAPPPRTPEEPALAPIGLGAVGDIEFWAPNRGLLITAGSGSTIPAGLWAYDGVQWHEMATVCGASDGRIAWAAPEEFWTVSDGRPGQAAEANGTTPPLEDDTLCHFAGGQVVTSYASPAFEATSYQPMHAAGCMGPSDCWFGGDPLPEPQIGAFQLHWNGVALSAEPNPQGHTIEDMRLFGGRLYESVRLSAQDRLTDPESPQQPPILRRINPEGVQPTFVPLSPGVPEYAPGESAQALDFLHLSADGEALWGAAGAASEASPAQTTVVRYAEGAWTQVLGPSQPPRVDPFPQEIVSSLAAEPGSASAWVALDTRSDATNPSPDAMALVARVSASGAVTDEQTLPSAEEVKAGIGPRGAAKQISCPAPHDCWMVTTQGWLFHLAPEGARRLSEDTAPAFRGPITFRPPDEGLPQVAPDAPPIDDSGVDEAPSAPIGALLEVPAAATQTRVTVPLLSHLHTRLLRRDVLELRFRLAVKARVRLLARRRRNVVASTPTRTLAAGTRQLTLRLDPRRWPTKLDLQTHPLAPLPTVAGSGASGGGGGGGAGPNAVATSLFFPETSAGRLWRSLP